MATQKKERLLAISINQGVIEVIESNGHINWYLQRGIHSLYKHSREIVEREVQLGNLDYRWRELSELPNKYSIEFEDPEIQGKASATYPMKAKLLAEAKKCGV